MLPAAAAWLSRVLPMWWVSAPQQPAPAAITTSQPCRVSSRIVAALIRGSSTRCAQPVSSATRMLPRALGREDLRVVQPGSAAAAARGAIASIARSRVGHQPGERPPEPPPRAAPAGSAAG